MSSSSCSRRSLVMLYCCSSTRAKYSMTRMDSLSFRVRRMSWNNENKKKTPAQTQNTKWNMKPIRTFKCPWSNTSRTSYNEVCCWSRVCLSNFHQWLVMCFNYELYTAVPTILGWTLVLSHDLHWKKMDKPRECGVHLLWPQNYWTILHPVKTF